MMKSKNKNLSIRTANLLVSKSLKRVVLLLFLLTCTFSCAQQPNTSVSFSTSDSTLQKLYNRAEALAKGNIIDYGDRKVLKEGAKYVSVWLETQPMGGYMYAKRNMEVATNNIEIFMDYQREDGRLPGVIYNRQGVVTPNYAQFQGLYFAMPAYEQYFLLGKDTTYLNRVYKALKGFDAYLWKTRDSDNNGCLETWCVYDNGEDGSVRFNGEYPKAWAFDFPPSEEAMAKLSKEELIVNCKQEEYDSKVEMTVPIESMDVMSYSYSCRHVLSLIAKELKNGKEEYWNEKAEQVRSRLKSYLWDTEKKACFDKDKNNKTMPILLHNNLRCMYLGSFEQEMANDFIKDHLVNRKEFWTPMPLPSIAANDSKFENTSGNNWSGQPQGLTYQRSIRALENYGHYAELTGLGLQLLDVIGRSMKFTQQFDTFTATADTSKDGYGPSILTALEFIGRFYGVHLSQDKIYWSCLDDENDYDYIQNWNGNSFELKTEGDQVICSKNGKLLFTFSKGARVVTDLSGNLIEVIGISRKPKEIKLKTAQEHVVNLEPNMVFGLTSTGKLELSKSKNFYKPRD